MSFTLTQKVLFKHCDPAGIVFYPRYFEMINDCVEAFSTRPLAIRSRYCCAQAACRPRGSTRLSPRQADMATCWNCGWCVNGSGAPA